MCIRDRSISALSSVSADESAADQALRADIAAPDSRYLVVVGGADLESALAAAERAGERLDRLIAGGVISGYDSPARFLPSLATQKARCASLPEAADLRARLAAAQAGSPLAATRLGGFVDDVASAREQCSLTRESLTGTGLALVVDALLLQRPDGWTALLPLHPPSGDQGPEIASAPVRDTLTGSNALFIDMKGEFDQLYSDYLHEAMLLSLAGFAAIVALLGITLRSLKRLAAVMLPLVLAVLMVSAGLSAIGERLHLMHLIGMLLIVAVGSNYALFFDHAKVQRELDPETLASMLVANLTTAIGFGTLALSKVPVLHAVGVTVGPGAILTLLLAAILVSRPVPQ